MSCEDCVLWEPGQVCQTCGQPAITDEMIERAARAAVDWAREAQPEIIDMALRCGDRTMVRSLLTAALHWEQENTKGEA